MVVDIDALEFSDQHLYELKGKPFSGTARENYPSGKTYMEMVIVDGIQEGVTKEWYETGALRSEAFYKKGGLHGSYIEWFENGQLKRTSYYEFDILISMEEKNEEGKVIDKYELSPNSIEHQTLTVARRLDKKSRS
tara:strand:- start:1206 stop:1613 length:408 start_codon:yes stop_codon:yes gene_type:complete